MVTCGKVRFATRGQADKSLRTIRRNGNRDQKKPTRAYLCEQCNGWHLTSQPN